MATSLPVLPTQRDKVWAPILFLCAVALAAAAGVQFSSTSVWYNALEKPSFQPPAGLFAPVWTVLYVLMAISAWRVWKTPPSAARRQALWLWFIQLAFNASWSVLFFGQHVARWALLDLCVLLVTVLGYSLRAVRVDRPAAWMMVPYLGWLSFAGLLNLEIVLLNPALKG